MPWDDKDLYGDEKPWRYIAHIQESKAGTTSYNDGKTTLLILDGKRQDAEQKDLDDWHLWVPAKGFEAADSDGTMFTAEDGDEKKRFHPSSKIQRFITSAVEAGVPLQERGVSSLDASMWKGISVVIEEVKEKGEFGGEKREWRQPLVKAFLGEFEGEPEYIDKDVDELVEAAESTGAF